MGCQKGDFYQALLQVVNLNENVYKNFSFQILSPIKNFFSRICVFFLLTDSPQLLKFQWTRTLLQKLKMSFPPGHLNYVLAIELWISWSTLNCRSFHHIFLLLLLLQDYFFLKQQLRETPSKAIQHFASVLGARLVPGLPLNSCQPAPSPTLVLTSYFVAAEKEVEQKPWFYHFLP